MLYYTQGLVLSQSDSGSRRWLCHLWANLLLLWDGSIGRGCCRDWGVWHLLGTWLLLRRLVLDVVLAQVVLQVQERQLNTLWNLQQRLQLIIEANLLPCLQTVRLKVLVHVVRYLGARDHLLGTQAQEGAQSIGHLLGLIETVVLGASLLLLTGRVLNVLANLANLLAHSLELLHQGVESYGGIGGGSHLILYTRDRALSAIAVSRITTKITKPLKKICQTFSSAGCGLKNGADPFISEGLSLCGKFTLKPGGNEPPPAGRKSSPKIGYGPTF